MASRRKIEVHLLDDRKPSGNQYESARADALPYNDNRQFDAGNDKFAPPPRDNYRAPEHGTPHFRIAKPQI